MHTIQSFANDANDAMHCRSNFFLLWHLLSVAAKSSFVRDKVLQPQWLDQPIFALFHSYTKNSCSLLVSKIFFLLTNSEQEFFLAH